jgi:hypothetical protein
MKAFFTICFIILFGALGIAQSVRTENTASLNPAGCPTLYPTQYFYLCDAITVTITPVIHTIGSASIIYTWAVPPFSNILGGTNQMELVTYNGGVYTVTASNSSTGCSDVMTYSVLVCNGIEENNTAGALVSVFPNPCITTIEVQLNASVTVLLFNSAGTLLVSKLYKPGKNMLDLSSFASGIYYLRISNATHSKAFKLIKE